MKTRLSCAFMLALAGCQDGRGEPAETAMSYRIAEHGSAETKDRTLFNYIEEKSFRREQAYRFIAEGDRAKTFHFVIADVKKKVGKNTESVDDPSFIPIKDGIGDFKCSHFYNLGIKAAEDQVDNPTCTFTILGALFPEKVGQTK